MHFAFKLQCGVSLQSSTWLVDRAFSQVEWSDLDLNRPMCSEGSELTYSRADRGGMGVCSIFLRVDRSKNELCEPRTLF